MREIVQKRATVVIVFTTILGFLAGCAQTDDTATPTVSIATPASGSSVSATVAVQSIAGNDAGVSKVQVYVRSRGSASRGVLVGAATREPFVVSWFTPAVPNGSEVELVAVAYDEAGNAGESDPVPVRVSNPGVPNVEYLAAFTLPPKTADVAAAGTDTASAIPANAPTWDAVPPVGSARVSSARLAPASVRPLADTARTYALEWAWNPFAGAEGYGVYLGEDLVGPYQVQVKQAASTGADGPQRYSRTANAQPGDVRYGLVTAISNGATSEGGYSNADAATFLSLQDSASPADGQTVSDARPTFTWTVNPQAVGYLCYVYDKNPWDPTAKRLWTNYPQTTSALSATYPADTNAAAPLESGKTYWWWVAGVAFDDLGRADAFSFSEPRRFTIP